MKCQEPLKLFISYSHEDEHHIQKFKKHTALLKDENIINDWYDRKIVAGKNWEQEIDNNLDNADIICLFVSANFLSSEACKRETEKAFELQKKKGILVIPIILSDCAWKDNKNISELLALPIDGKSIDTWDNKDTAWTDVYEGLKKAIEEINEIRQLKTSDEFKEFLNDAEMLTHAHNEKATVQLDDIFIHPELAKHDDSKEYEKNISSENIIQEFYNSKIVIAGNDQSGKTVLCKMFFKQLRENNLIPVYIIGKDDQETLPGKIENRIEKAFYKQYAAENNFQIDKIDKRRIIPIIDDFHKAKDKERHIEDLSAYPNTILTVDDIYALDIENTKILESFIYFKINELKPTLRNELIKQWLSLSDKDSIEDQYKELDKQTEIINQYLGKLIGNKGIMPAYPFFVLNIIHLHNTVNKPLEEITSQGYCYQAIIYIALRKQNVKNEHVDFYINFLIEFSFFLLEQDKNELSNDDFNTFIQEYKNSYNLPPNIEENILKVLQDSHLINKDSCNYFSFRYKYIFYFFVAKYLADNLEEKKTIIDKMIQNIHKDKNAYISVFIVHHTKNNYILDEIVLNAMCLFEKYKPTTLNSCEVKFFDEKRNEIIPAILSNKTSEQNRIKKLQHQDQEEEASQHEIEDNEENNLEDDIENGIVKELRKSIKTVEVMGRIVKNRAGSLKKERLKEIFKEGMNVLLRLLTSFFEFIKQKESQEFFIDHINHSIEKITKNNTELSDEKRREIAGNIFWNMNFYMIYAIIQKSIQSLGAADILNSIIKEVCEEQNTPAAFLVQQGINMWYSKTLDRKMIKYKMKEEGFSETAQIIMKHQIARHCSMHKMKQSEKQQIADAFNIPIKRL